MLVGINFNINVKDCTNTASISGVSEKVRVGGVIGWVTTGDSGTSTLNYSGNVNIINCKNESDIEANGAVGGIIGYSMIYYRTNYVVNVEKCLNVGNITSQNLAAAGTIAAINGGIYNISECANIGNISATTKAGGIVGFLEKSTNAKYTFG